MIVDWTAVIAIVGIIGNLALVASALLVLAQLRRQSEEEFVAGTATTFQIWMEDEFQRALQWILYDLNETTWRGFAAAHRNDYGERAFLRVGGYFNRIGYLVTHHLLGNEDQLLLDSVAASAIAVWQKIEPLVLEARLIENSNLFSDYEMMLPECYECYMPGQPIPPSARVPPAPPI